MIHLQSSLWSSSYKAMHLWSDGSPINKLFHVLDWWPLDINACIFHLWADIYMCVMWCVITLFSKWHSWWKKNHKIVEDSWKHAFGMQLTYQIQCLKWTHLIIFVMYQDLLNFFILDQITLILKINNICEISPHVRIVRYNIFNSIFSRD